METISQSFSVGYNFPVAFTRNLFAKDNPIFRDAVTRIEAGKQHRLYFVIDDNVARANPRLISDIHGYCNAYPDSLRVLGEIKRVPGGEAAKNDPALVFDLVEQVSALGIDRQSFLVAIGGGAVLDMVGFAAGIAHRGIRAIRVPTTVLSQNDSGVGVKNGINLHGKKNFIGTFAPPFAVLNDFNFIDTLTHRDKIAGIAEAVKVALIRDRDFFEYLESNGDQLARADREVIAYLIQRSAKLHLEHIRTSGDPFEFGSARPLDFGHWAAHKLESMTQHRLRHGEAVAIGMALDTVYSVLSGRLPESQSERVLALLETVGLDTWDDALAARSPEGGYLVLDGLREFQEHLGGILHITLLEELGKGIEVNEMDLEMVEASMELLRARPGIANAASAQNRALG